MNESKPLTTCELGMLQSLAMNIRSQPPQSYFEDDADLIERAVADVFHLQGENECMSQTWADMEEEFEGLGAAVQREEELVVKLLSNIQHLYKTIGAQSGTCKDCGQPIWWVTTQNDKSAPFTARGLNHFADCCKADRFRRKVKL